MMSAKYEAEPGDRFRSRVPVTEGPAIAIVTLENETLDRKVVLHSPGGYGAAREWLLQLREAVDEGLLALEEVAAVDTHSDLGR